MCNTFVNHSNITLIISFSKPSVMLIYQCFLAFLATFSSQENFDFFDFCDVDFMRFIGLLYINLTEKLLY